MTLLVIVSYLTVRGGKGSEYLRVETGKANLGRLACQLDDELCRLVIVIIAGQSVEGVAASGKHRLRAHNPFGCLCAVIASSYLPAQCWGACG